MEVGHGDFFVYTSHEYHLNCVIFSKDMWEEMVCRMEYMWLIFVAPELDCGFMSLNVVAMDHSYNVVPNPASPEPSGSPMHMNMPVSSTSTVLATPKLPRVFFYGVCGLDCNVSADNCAQSNDNCVQSCKCVMWVHFGCTDIKPENVPDEDDIWFCTVCCI